MRRPRHEPGAVLERLRQGPLRTADASECAADYFSLKVLVCRLRKAGFVIESEPDLERVTKTGRPHGKAVRYVLKSEPELLLEREFDETKGLS